MVSAKNSEYADNRETLTCDELQQIVDQAEGYQGAQVGLQVAGGVLAAAGGGLLLWHYLGHGAERPAGQVVLLSVVTGVVGLSSQGSVLHYDGSQWSAMTSGSKTKLLAVWGSSASSVFAVGLNGVINHFDGAKWSSQMSNTGLLAVGGTSATNTFAVGYQGRYLRYAVGQHGTVVHYDGLGWQGGNVGSPVYLYAVWGSGPKDLYVAGLDGVIMHRKLP